MTGHYAPGARLKEEHLAAELAVSRTPVRAALQRLAGEGMAVAVANRGIFVAEWTEQDIAEVFELRSLLEPHAAGLAAERASPGQVAEFKLLNERLEAAAASAAPGRIAEIQSINNRFHRLLITAAGAPRLRAMSESLVDMPVIIGSFYFYTDAEILRSLAHHRDIAFAIELRDRDYAEQATRLHLKATYELFMRRRRDRAGLANTSTGGVPGPD
jgi:DNA-binding GntR family transcriptional regulator